MRYFEIRAEAKGIDDQDRDAMCELSDALSAAYEKYHSENPYKYYGCVTNIRNNDCFAYFCGNGSTESIHKEIAVFMGSLPFENKVYDITELPMKVFSTKIRFRRNSNIPRNRYSERKFALIDDTNLLVNEKVVLKTKKEHCLIHAEKHHLFTLSEETERIFSGGSDKFMGHPVHYMICCNGKDMAFETAELLTGALLENNRLLSGRLAHVAADENLFRFEDNLAEIYENLDCGALMISLANDENEDEFSFGNDPEGFIKNICRLASGRHNKVLTILHMPRNCENLRKTIDSVIDDELSFVTIREDAVDLNGARKYLLQKAENEKIDPADRVLEHLGDDEQMYYISDLELIYDGFYKEYLRKVVYSQYSNIKTVKTEKPAYKGKAGTELDAMIGLDNIKKIIKKAVNFYRMQKLYTERNIPLENASYSMVFTGNPGTAKTTTARLFARILKDNGIIQKGELVEVGRADLVGKYVGWTAKQVKDIFRRARGSVLLIDEAYSLVDDRSGMYGDEAINTIVQEMENLRHEVIVIFAGYPDKMEEFLDRNPGLRSRIAFYVDFPDYSTSELIDILRLMAEKRHMTLTDEALEMAEGIISGAVNDHDFGNGRYVRNLLEKAMLNMSDRIFSGGSDCITDAELTTILAEDIPASENKTKIEKQRKIGF